jgi:hypothetical protein
MVIAKISATATIPRLGVRFFASATSVTGAVSRPRLPLVIKPSIEEVRNSLLNERNLEQAVRAVHLDGLAVINDVVPHVVIDSLNKKMVEDALVLQARGKDSPFNYNQGNLQQDAPPVAEHFHPSIFLSKSSASRCSSDISND